MSQEEKNFTADWDSVEIQISKDDKPHGAIRMMKQDLENMEELHGMNRGEILEMLLNALVTTEKPNA
jgi:hypothetical protein